MGNQDSRSECLFSCSGSAIGANLKGCRVVMPMQGFQEASKSLNGYWNVFLLADHKGKTDERTGRLALTPRMSCQPPCRGQIEHSVSLRILANPRHICIVCKGSKGLIMAADTAKSEQRPAQDKDVKLGVYYSQQSGRLYGMKFNLTNAIQRPMQSWERRPETAAYSQIGSRDPDLGQR